MLEGPFEGHLHKTIWIGPDGVQFSVSRLNQRLNLILLLFWMLLLAVSACLVLNAPRQPPSWIDAILGLIMISAAAGSLFCTRSDLKRKIYEKGADGWQPWPRDKQKSYRILRRYAPGEE